jgi:hypothetical protein
LPKDKNTTFSLAFES